jgi:hypothetical protein
VTGNWRRLHNELHNLHASPYIVRVIKSRGLKWTEHIACMEEMRNMYSILVGKPKGKRPLGGVGVDEKRILEWIIRK